MGIAAGCLIVFALATVALWSAIPIGFALGVPALLVGACAAAGAVAGAAIGVFLGERLRFGPFASLVERAKASASGAAHRVAARFGVAGLGLLAPAITGSVIAALLGGAIGLARRTLLLWISVGIVLWTVALTLINLFGIELFL